MREKLCVFGGSLLLVILLLPDARAAEAKLSKTELDQLEDVWNCRDAAWEATEILPGKLLRCGNSDAATENDVELITRHFGPISAMMDLRNLGEVDPGALRKLRTHSGKTQHYSVPLGGSEIMTRVIAERASWFSLLKYAYHRFIEWNLKKAHGEMIQYIRGLAGFNQLILQNEGPSLNKALQTVTKSVENHNVLISCSAGKDRTGLVVAVALAVAGVPKEKIALEYHQSHRHKETILRRAIQHLTELDEWSSAPERVIYQTFDFIEEKFGSMDLYLSSIGFDHRWRNRLRLALTSNATSSKDEADHFIWSRIL
jgi:hypothetical protein